MADQASSPATEKTPLFGNVVAQSSNRYYQDKSASWFPFAMFGWLAEYDAKAHAIRDIMAGITIGVMLVPQSMAYAMLAGLPPTMGLYSSMVPLLVYPVFGTSKHAAVGPVSAICVLIQLSLQDLGATPQEKMPLAITLAMLCGFVTASLGLLRIGFMQNVLSVPILDGFISAVAILISLTQLEALLGLPNFPPGLTNLEQAQWAVQHLPQAHLETSLVGLGSMLVLLLGMWAQSQAPKALWPKAAVLVVTLTSIGVVYKYSLDSTGLQILGPLPSGFPSFQLPDLDHKTLRSLISSAIVISLIGFVESIAVTKKLAAKHGYQVDANSELLSLGLANLAGSCFQSFPVFVSLTRTPISPLAGAASPLFGIISAGVVCAAIAVLMPYFYFMPICVMSAIIIVAICSLVSLDRLPFLWRISKKDFFFCLATFLVTLVLGIEIGILSSVLLSTALVIKTSSVSHLTRLRLSPDLSCWQEKPLESSINEPLPVMGPTKASGPQGGADERGQRLRLCVLRAEDHSLFFANASDFRERVQMAVSSPCGGLVMDMSRVLEIDSTAAQAIVDLAEHFNRLPQHIPVCFQNSHPEVQTACEVCGLEGVCGTGCFTTSTLESIEFVKAKLVSEPAASRSLHAASVAGNE